MGKGDDDKCQKCDVKCKTCKDSKTGCTSCSGNRRPKNCNCPTGHYDAGKEVCPKCGPKCATCEGAADKCISCKPPLVKPAKGCVKPDPVVRSAKVSDIPVGSAKAYRCSHKCKKCQE